MKLAILSKNKRLYSIRNFTKVANEYFDQVSVYSYKDIAVELDNNHKPKITLNNTDISEFTHILTRVSDQYYAQRYFIIEYARTKGIKVFNGDLILQFPYYNKLSTLAFLAQNGIDIVPTFFTLNYKQKASPYTYPIIGKNNLGRLAKGIMKLDNDLQTSTFLKSKKASNILLQPYIPSRYDIRILLIGDKVIGAYKRTAQTSFITTKGGLNERYDITAKEKKLAQMVAKVLQSDYIGLDIIYDRGKPVILEVNFDAGFKTFDQINGTDVAEEIIKQLLKK